MLVGFSGGAKGSQVWVWRLRHKQDFPTAFQHFNGRRPGVVGGGGLRGRCAPLHLDARSDGAHASLVCIELGCPCGAGQVLRRSPGFGVQDLAIRRQLNRKRDILKPSGTHRHLHGKGVAEVGHLVHAQVGQVEVFHHGRVPRADEDVWHVELACAVLRIGAAVHPAVRHHDHGGDVAVDESVADGFKRPPEVGAFPVGLPAFRRQLDHVPIESQQSHLPLCRFSPGGQRADQCGQGFTAVEAVRARPLGGCLVHQNRQQGAFHRFGVASHHRFKEQQGKHAQRGQAQQRQQPRGFGTV